MEIETEFSSRIFYASGCDAYALGLDMGRTLGPRLAEAIEQYFAARLPGRRMPADPDYPAAALEYLNRLPDRFRNELEGLSAGAQVPIERLAEWEYLEQYIETSCTGAICLLDGHAWVARNNDFYAPHLWGYAAIRELRYRIPTITFGLLGDVFYPTGVNREQLWLHYNYLPAYDRPAPGKPTMPPFAFLVEALETCNNLRDLETRLDEIDRDGGMLLFAVDGKTDDFALYECMCQSSIKREPRGAWLVGANHFVASGYPVTINEADPLNSICRQKRMEELVQQIADFQEPVQLPGKLIRILADSGIEGRDPDSGTVYSCVACPAANEIWYTLGGYPAASQGRWVKLVWPWSKQSEKNGSIQE